MGAPDFLAEARRDLAAMKEMIEDVAISLVDVENLDEPHDLTALVEPWLRGGFLAILLEAYDHFDDAEGVTQPRSFVREGSPAPLVINLETAKGVAGSLEVCAAISAISCMTGKEPLEIARRACNLIGIGVCKYMAALATFIENEQAERGGGA